MRLNPVTFLLLMKNYLQHKMIFVVFDPYYPPKDHYLSLVLPTLRDVWESGVHCLPDWHFVWLAVILEKSFGKLAGSDIQCLCQLDELWQGRRTSRADKEAQCLRIILSDVLRSKRADSQIWPWRRNDPENDTADRLCVAHKHRPTSSVLLSWVCAQTILKPSLTRSISQKHDLWGGHEKCKNVIDATELH